MHQSSFICDHSWVDDIYYIKCKTCEGLGSLFVEDNNGNFSFPNCPDCSSKGKVPRHRLICTKCGEIDG